MDGDNDVDVVSFSHLIKQDDNDNKPPPIIITPAEVSLPTERYHQRLLRIFGWRFIVFLFVTQFILKGIAISIAMGVALPLFKTLLGVDASHLQLLGMIARLPWAVKPLFGLVADLIRIRGYHNRYWLLISLATGCLASGMAFLALQPPGSALPVVLCLMGIQFEIAVYDLLSEGCYSARMRDNPESGSDIVTLAQYFQTLGGIVALLFVGPLSDGGHFYALFTILAVLCMAPLGPTLAGWLPEQHHAEDACCIAMVGRDRLRRDAGMISIIAFTGLCAPVVTILANTWDPAVGAAVALLLSSTALVGAFFLFPPMIARIALFQVLSTLSAPRLGAAMDYFYTADADCLPGGPHFSFSYYMTVAGVVGSLASIAGAVLYQATLSKMRFRSVLIFTTLLSSAIGASDLFIVLRINIALGISDQWAYMVGEGIMESTIGMLNYIPVSTLLSKKVPPGMESSVFAFLAGINNFAGLTSSLMGALIFDAAGIRTIIPCDWSALWWLVLLCHVGLPAAVGIPASWLIPNKLQTEEL